MRKNLRKDLDSVKEKMNDEE
jgi:hypothetical protein